MGSVLAQMGGYTCFEQSGLCMCMFVCVYWCIRVYLYVFFKPVCGQIRVCMFGVWTVFHCLCVCVCVCKCVSNDCSTEVMERD